MDKVVESVTESGIIENPPNAGSNLFFLGSHVEQSHMDSPLEVITGQLGLRLNT